MNTINVYLVLVSDGCRSSNAFQLLMQIKSLLLHPDTVHGSSSACCSLEIGVSTPLSPAWVWWGPTNTDTECQQNVSPPHSPFSLSAASACLDEGLHLQTSGWTNDRTRFSRYFGYIGVPPSVITEGWENDSSQADDNKDPPPWGRACWSHLQHLWGTVLKRHMEV